ncbi:DUF3618 domain-containing protein [Isoptericola sp. JC619]|uniref:DUF3618 domain-containing protein n=2 Tax=Promicromonosporaceae TaxID=85017 RepID=A0A849K784_9MICO|nr:DUF3618 domain-containing protein [Isoptericola sediminis]NNU27047.1 DUF3618 domain-containing protein [Isoptericola sediminis]
MQNGVPARSREELQADVVDARRELGDALDALTTRLSPAHQASRLAHGTRQAATDARGLFDGTGLPDDAPRSRNVKILLGAAALGAAALTALVVRAVARR